MMIEETKEQREMRLKLNRRDDLKERENAFYTLYGVKSQKAILELFEDEVSKLKIIFTQEKKLSKKAKEMQEQKSKEVQYPKILELILKYSHAIFYLYGKSQINKNLIAFRKVAMINIDDENVDKAFKTINRLRDYKEEKEEEEELIITGSCLALGLIERLKKQLEDGVKANKGGNKEDKEAYIQIAIIALSTGAKHKEILDEKLSYSIDPKKSLYDVEYISNLLLNIQEYQKTRNFSERVVRNGIDNLELPLSQELQEKEAESYQSSFEKWQEAHKEWEQSDKTKREPAKPILSKHCRNINHLNFLYKECVN